MRQTPSPIERAAECNWTIARVKGLVLYRYPDFDTCLQSSQVSIQHSDIGLFKGNLPLDLCISLWGGIWQDL
jgi:hypothetical protein